ncbi:MAG TPA: hypothetical protein DC053_13725 [Lachnoclostridium sp.]|nr:hypothetical protein [Lachnoclostridium sp.]
MYKRKYGILPAICLTLMMSSATVTLAADTQQAGIEVKGYIGPRSAAPSNRTGSAETSNRTKAPNSAAQPSGSKSSENSAPETMFPLSPTLPFSDNESALPKTGDRRPLLLYLLFVMAGGGGIAVCLQRLIKKDGEKHDWNEVGGEDAANE